MMHVGAIRARGGCKKGTRMMHVREEDAIRVGGGCKKADARRLRG